MISLVRFYIVGNICSRSISSGKFQIKRESRMLDKMISKKISLKKKVNNPTGKLKQEFLSSAYSNEGSTRKTVALNKFYMEQLIQLISSGPFSGQVTELGIEFTKVKITACRSSINMYWILSNPETPESAVAEILKSLKKDLQAQMGFLIPMRKIPFITFVNDLRMERHNIVERLLEVADFGKDFQPKSAKKVVNSESNELQKSENADNLLMRQNVLGLDHAKIKEELMQSMKRFHPINVKQNEPEDSTQYEHPGELAVFSKKLFNSFYKRKIYLEKKLRTREYADSFIEFNKSYDPEEEAEKYWECFKFQEDFTDNGQEQELEGYYRNLYEDDSGEENDDYYEERGIDDNGGDDKESDSGDDELGKSGKFSEKK